MVEPSSVIQAPASTTAAQIEPSWLDWLQAGSSTLEAVAVLFAAGIALYGINTWKREHVGKRRIELAEETLTMFYETRIIIKAIRSRYVYGSEGSSRKPVEGETERERHLRDKANVLNERFARHRETLSRLSTARFRFMAVFGTDKAWPFEDFEALMKELIGAAEHLGELLSIHEVGLRPTDFENYEKQVIEARKLFYGSGDETDLFTFRLDKIIADVEEICAPVISKA